MMILDQIVAETRRTVARRKETHPIAALEEQARLAPPARGFGRALRKKPIACIAEVKRRSPSAGWIREGADAGEIARGYEAAGAAALSILTDQPFFGGALDDLRQVRSAVSIPLLRKDFTVDRYQIVEARAAGADAILLIVSALSDDELRSFLAEADRLGLDALVETHDETEIRRALAIGARIIGVNHRDLRTFQMDMELAVRMRPQIPSDKIIVAESGIRNAADVERMRAAGIDAVLVGENLMRAPSPGDALRALLGGT